jgi:hypothetical protein
MYPARTSAQLASCFSLRLLPALSLRRKSCWRLKRFDGNSTRYDEFACFRSLHCHSGLALFPAWNTRLNIDDKSTGRWSEAEQNVGGLLAKSYDDVNGQVQMPDPWDSAKRHSCVKRPLKTGHDAIANLPLNSR